MIFIQVLEKSSYLFLHFHWMALSNDKLTWMESIPNDNGSSFHTRFGRQLFFEMNCVRNSWFIFSIYQVSFHETVPENVLRYLKLSTFDLLSLPLTSLHRCKHASVFVTEWMNEWMKFLLLCHAYSCMPSPHGLITFCLLQLSVHILHCLALMFEPVPFRNFECLNHFWNTVYITNRGRCTNTCKIWHTHFGTRVKPAVLFVCFFARFCRWEQTFQVPKNFCFG